MTEKLTASPAATAAAGARPARTNPPTVVVPAKPASLRRGVLELSAKSLKVTTVIPAIQLAGLVVPHGQPHIAFTIDVNGRAVTGALNARTLRRVCSAIGEHDPDNVTVVLQGNLVNESIEAAGISAQPKAPRPQ